MDDAPDILFERHGVAGIVTLNRPKALNAITHAMVQALAAQLSSWRTDPAVARVIVTASGPRAFSAGGDIRSLYDLGRRDYEQALRFFRDEYRLNAAIKTYPKPYIALIDGLVMGGGVGVSVHGSHRVASERFSFAMPEVGIGFFPDVGATWVLPRLPGELGTWCALTGERMAAADAVAAGIATQFVPADRFEDLKGALCRDDPVNMVLAKHSGPAGAGPLADRLPAIDRLFAGDSVEGILAALDGEASRGSDHAVWAAAAAKIIRTKSPVSLKIALAQMRRGRGWSFEDCMRAELRIVSRVLKGQDFYEGIRSAVIDKDNRPRWSVATVEEVGAAVVDQYFAPIPAELELP